MKPMKFRLITRSRIGLIFVVITMLSGFSIHSTAAEYTLHVGPNGWVPFVRVDREGADVSHYGILFDFLDQFEAAHPEFSRRNVLSTRKRVNSLMKRGESIDVMLTSPLFVSAEVLEHYKFTDALVRTHDKVFSRKDQNFLYKTPHDLVNRKVGTIRGYSYGHLDFLMNFEMFDDVRVDSHSQAIGMLNKNRIDAYIGNSLVTPLYIRLMGLDIEEFRISEASLYEFNLAFAVSKKQPELFEKLNMFVNDFVAKGSFDTLLEKYVD